MSGAPVSRCACTAARTTFRSLAVHGQVVPIADEARADPGLAHAAGDLVNDLPREVIHRPRPSMSGGCEAAQ
jgi:hypothetical protein